MSTAFLFPGQGTDIAPVLAEWSAGSAAARARLSEAAAMLDTDLDSLLARGGVALQTTAVGQPMLTALNLAIEAELRGQGTTADCVAGHSLGEMAAWAASGSIDPRTAVELAVLRGRVMAEAAAAGRGGMLALLDADAAAVDEALDLGSSYGIVELAAHNAPDEWVLTGEIAALDAVARKFASRRLVVDGAWHSRLMAGAEAEFARALSDCPVGPARVPFYCNATGEVVDDPRALAGVLAGQLTRPIRFVGCIRSMHRDGTDQFVVCGPGKTLRTMVRKILGAAVPVRVIASPADLEALKE